MLKEISNLQGQSIFRPATYQFSFFFFLYSLLFIFMYLFIFPSSMNVCQVLLSIIIVLSPTLTHAAKDPSLIDVFAFIDTYQFKYK